ncbi:hypothetical protein HYX18_00400 [Candidatus Woesearchaeota archaeon]|nr:hypothetical protein [Candidatus Woesearchaeota archaeon]
MFFALNVAVYQETLRIYGIQVWNRFLELLYAPLQHKEMLWILAPLIFTLLMIEFYFGIYVEEELGWNSAFANTLVLLFVSLDLGRNLFEKGLLFNDSIKTVIVLAVFIEAILLAFFDFFHIIPERFAFKISSSLPINFIAISAILLIYSSIRVDYITISALVLLAIILSFVIGFLHFIEPKVGNSKLLEHQT